MKTKIPTKKERDTLILTTIRTYIAQEIRAIRRERGFTNATVGVDTSEEVHDLAWMRALQAVQSIIGKK